MRIKPREQILGVWRSLLTACYRDGEWVWDGRNGSNSISDAEQLLCLLYPATEIDGFGLEHPDEIADDIREVLSPLGDNGLRIGERVVWLLEQYIDRHTDRDPDSDAALPNFAAGSYLATSDGAEPTPAQRTLEVVDSYSMSLTLCLAALKFLRGFSGPVAELAVGRRIKLAVDLGPRIEALDVLINVRLTAAMVGLIRSFVVNTVSPKSAAGQAMLSMLNQTGGSPDAVVHAVQQRLDRVRIRLRNDATLSQVEGVDLDSGDMLFECGWSWAIVRKAASIDFVDMPIADQPGHAVARPYLHFTVVALDGINDLTSVRTRELDLLNGEQRRLAEALQLRWDLAQRYWAAVARFGTGRWPLEDIPWRTSDGEESDYFSLVVSAVLMQDLLNREANDDDLDRAATIFDELARRGRIVRRFTADDPARTMHTPGVSLRLLGSEALDGPLLLWTVSDYATVLLKRTLQAARLSGTIETRDQLMTLAQATMDHLDLRAFREGPATGLWDDPSRIFGGPENHLPSWYLTERVVECMVTAARLYREPPLRAPTSVTRAMELLTEAEHLLNREMLELSETDVSAGRTALALAEQRLERARTLIDERPGTAVSLASQALLELDELAYARFDATRSV